MNETTHLDQQGSNELASETFPLHYGCEIRLLFSSQTFLFVDLPQVAQSNLNENTRKFYLNLSSFSIV